MKVCTHVGKFLYIMFGCSSA